MSAAGLVPTPHPPPAPHPLPALDSVLDLNAAYEERRALAATVLHGRGVEIGALHRPVTVPDGVSVQYLDRMSAPELQAHHPELEGAPLVPVDLIDDGELLSTITE